MKYSPRQISRYLLRRSGQSLVSWGNGLTLLASNIENSLTVDQKKILQTNKKFFNKHKNKRAFVVANGPSLIEQDLRPLKNEITFTMSGIWKSSLINEGWIPTYYTLADPIFFTPETGFESVREFFMEVRKRLSKTTAFMPLGGQLVIEKERLLKNMKVQYVNFQGALADEHKQPLDIDFTHSVPGVQSVAQMGIELAIYMGCNPIYLIGFDHDWLAHRGAYRNFYKGKTLKNHPKAHADLDKFRYKDDLRDTLTLWKGYERLNSIANKKGQQIVNATAGGFLDVFPRAEYAELFKGKKK